MRILVTGLDGFTGHFIQEELEKCDHHVVGLLKDLTNAQAVEHEIEQLQPEAVIHLAAVAFVGHGDANAFYEVNLIGTRNLLQALARHVPNVRSVLLVSSAGVYGNRSDGSLSEDMLPDPANDYGVSKLAMEQMAHLWSDQLPLFIVRPFNYTGVGQDEMFLVPKIVAHFRDKKPVIELGNLEVWREFGDVRCVANIYRRLLEQNPVGKTLNICKGQSYSLQELVDICENITGHKIEIQVNPAFVRPNEVRVLQGNNEALRSVVGDLDYFELEDTLRWMLQAGTQQAGEK